VAEVSTEPGEIAAQLSKARKCAVEMGELKAEATSWVLRTKAAATQKVRATCIGYRVDELKAMAEAEPEYLAALIIRGDIAATADALKSMHYEILNDRRTSRF